MATHFPSNKDLFWTTLFLWASFTLTVLSICDRSSYCGVDEACSAYETETHCFFVYNQRINWHASDALCKSYGAQLAEIYDVTTANLFRTMGNYAWLNGRPSDFSQWTYLRNKQLVSSVDSSTLDSWQTHCGVLVQESTRNQDGSQNYRIWLTTRKCSERMHFICRKTIACSLTESDCIVAIEEEMSWYEARAHCDRLGRDLLWIDYSERIEDVNFFLPPNAAAAMFFVGFTKRLWKWQSTQSDMLFCRWSYHDPNEEASTPICLHTYPDGSWGDTSCQSYFHPVCMTNKKSEVTPTTSVSTTTLEQVEPKTPTGSKMTTTQLTDKPTTTTMKTTTTTTTKATTPSTTQTTTTLSTVKAVTPSTTTTTTTKSPFGFTLYPRRDSVSESNTPAPPGRTPDRSVTSSKEERDSKDGVIDGPNDASSNNTPKDNVTLTGESKDATETKSPVLSYGVIAGVVVGVTVSATCLLAAVALVINSHNKARRRLSQNLPTYPGDTCRSFVFDNVVDPAPTPKPINSPKQMNKLEITPNASDNNVQKNNPRSIPLHYQNVNLTVDSTDSSRGLTSQDKNKERRKHTYVNLFNKNRWPPNKDQCNC